jgi:hypothetical protein
MSKSDWRCAMRATDLKPSRKVRNEEGTPTMFVDIEVPAYLQYYERERDAWQDRVRNALAARLRTRGDNGVASASAGA